jgi:hypothetical protein
MIIHSPLFPEDAPTGADTVLSRSRRVNPGVLVAVVCGVILAASLVELAVRGWREWEHTTGLVVDRPMLPPGKKRATVDFTYTYAAAGRTYRQTTRVSRAPGESPSSLVARFSPGTPVPVYYDPRRPERSRLFGSPRGSPMGGLLFGGLGLVLGIAYALLFPGSGRNLPFAWPGAPGRPRLRGG